MKRQLALVSLLLSILLSIAASTMAADSGKTAARPVSGAPSLPDEVVYWHLFRHVVALAKHADVLEKRGEDATKLRSLYKTLAQLSEAQARVLDDTATECTAQVAAQDRRAQEVIRAARAKPGEGSRWRGGTPPPPPAELAALQEERNAIILRAREKLQRELGEPEFQRFHAFVQEHVGRQIRSLAAGLKSPAATQPRARQ